MQADLGRLILVCDRNAPVHGHGSSHLLGLICCMVLVMGQDEGTYDSPSRSAESADESHTQSVAPQSPSDAARVSDRPHRFTIWLASSALVVSAASAFLSGLQWFEAHSARNRPSPVQVIESPRLSFESASAVKLLQGRAGIKVEFPSVPASPNSYHKTHTSI